MKKFLVIGNLNAISYKEIFPLIKENKLWFGVRPATGGMWFTIDDETSCGTKKVVDGKLLGNTKSIWFTNLDNSKRHSPITLTQTYSSGKYPKYDNYNAIEVSRTKDIPMDYDGVMGVPISFLDKYCPEQFEIVGMMSGVKDPVFANGNDGRAKFYVNDKGVYARILIKLK